MRRKICEDLGPIFCLTKFFGVYINFEVTWNNALYFPETDVEFLMSQKNDLIQTDLKDLEH